ncbi:helix-turn-helix transcriptional regulator [Actinomadura atramentaria]|uniref:helix-turn-helix transcriptional regulator n=1 Tax=Actinomadura atramentaria TaxID=1990 RepID=UPI001F0B6592|nr:AAA family ATPase [Actinomadura atramentaria]
MTTPLTSPVLVGRGAELDVLRRSLADAPGAVLVGGEAGLGKTRLVREFVADLDDESRALVGGCLELGSDGLPFAPFTTMLRGLVRSIGPDGIARLLPRGDTGGLARLLPEFGEPETDAPSGEERARLFELVLILLEGLAAEGPVVLAVEDAHWADRSTRDLLAFLIRNLGAAPLLILVTYRTDELHRTHPLRPLLAELSRLDRVQRLDLERLTRHEVAELTEVILGDAPQYDLVSRIHARSEGNPLFIEALLDADGTLACELPESLRDLLLAGVQRLPEETQDVLRDAAGGGTRIDHRLLSAVSGLDDGALTRVLRPAVAANVLVVDGDGYAFRHALIRETLHDDLLPGEYTRLHTRYAEALERDPGLVPAGRLWVELSHHWLAAHDATSALVSAWRAAADARKAVAYAECLAMLSRVLELWERVPDAAERIGADHVEVLESAAAAAESAGEYERGIKLVGAALRALGDARSERRAALLMLRGAMLHQLARPGFIEDLQAAVDALDEPTVLRARALSTLAQYGRLTTGIDDARRAATESLEIARRLGDGAAETHALVTLFCVDMDYDSDIDRIDEVAEAVRRADSAGATLRLAVIKSHYLEGAGRHEEAAAVARRGIEQAREFGVARTQGSFLSINRAEPLQSLGRWDEALVVLRDAFAQDPAVTIRTSLLVIAGEIALARGDLDAAATDLDAALGVLGVKTRWLKTQDYFATLRLQAGIALARDLPEEALRPVAQVVATPGLPDDARYAWPVLVLGARAAAMFAPDADAVEQALAPIEKRARDLHVRGPAQEAWAMTYAAEAGHARGGRDIAPWDAAAEAWKRLGRPYERALALEQAVRCALAAAAHETAAERLAEAVGLARRLAAAPLCARLDDLARRVRGPRGATPLGLTPREHEVLRHLAEGRSNRDIAAALSISAKTASVHVSNILGKLGVANRGEAAATAHRLALFDGAAADS